jgi:hypothetical protein
VQGCQNLGCCWDATATPAAASADDDAGGLIAGIAAAAGYLGYDKPDSFVYTGETVAALARIFDSLRSECYKASESTALLERMAEA